MVTIFSFNINFKDKNYWNRIVYSYWHFSDSFHNSIFEVSLEGEFDYKGNYERLSDVPPGLLLSHNCRPPLYRVLAGQDMEKWTTANQFYPFISTQLLLSVPGGATSLLWRAERILKYCHYFGLRGDHSLQTLTISLFFFRRLSQFHI